MARLLGLGSNAPTAEFVLQNGEKRSFADYQGLFLVLYFYPMDDTPGCRIEARGFRDLKAELEAAGSSVLGVSRQDEGSHAQFISKECLNFDLVVDKRGALAKAFGVRTLGPFTARRTFLIDPNGVVCATWPNVTPSLHAEEVLRTIQAKRAELTSNR